ncbi:hypothetical protein F511_11276 [Dorcoceras hygrometricum]|uniref:Uncharacterized protein n=1 Tax=Dorcoceras hygrometricum TaxID=472368 RepID=A0A2Z7AZK2_9LAMI|nr:hypothetical protein F511_11276 [Dorcoceras hygrometricum]
MIDDTAENMNPMKRTAAAAFALFRNLSVSVLPMIPATSSEASFMRFKSTVSPKHAAAPVANRSSILFVIMMTTETSRHAIVIIRAARATTGGTAVDGGRVIFSVFRSDMYIR